MWLKQLDNQTPSIAKESDETDKQIQKVEAIDSIFSMDDYTKELILSEDDFESLLSKLLSSESFVSNTTNNFKRLFSLNKYENF